MIFKNIVFFLFLVVTAFSMEEFFDEVHVKLKSENDLERIVPMLRPNQKIEPLFRTSKETLIKLSSAKPDLPNLTFWYRIVTMGPSLQEENKRMVQNLDFVEEAFIPKVRPPPATTQDFTTKQLYLHESSPQNGVDAKFSWKFPGGKGKGVKIYDVEYSWNLNHEDLVGKTAGIKPLVRDGFEPISPFSNNHGTAVLGEMVGNINTFGVTGISPESNVGVAAEYIKNIATGKSQYARADAILQCVEDGKAGDVILLEMQAGACGGNCGQDQIGCGPAEARLDVFDATKVATANGFVVVAAGGNGSMNLDSPACKGQFDRSKRDSGAIVVGAGGSGLPGCNAPRTKLGFSTYGSRFDVQGWGECTMTAGYGKLYKDPDDINNTNKWYTETFGGTSGASPMVASAVANIQGIAIAKRGFPLSPEEMRDLLTKTGIPQTGNSKDYYIGPLVNLKNAIEAIKDTLKPLSSSPTTTPIDAPSSSPTTTPIDAPSSSPTTTPSDAPSSSPTTTPSDVPSSSSTTTPSDAKKNKGKSKTPKEDAKNNKGKSKTPKGNPKTSKTKAIKAPKL